MIVPTLNGGTNTLPSAAASALLRYSWEASTAPAALTREVPGAAPPPPTLM